jgi:hypothetical protein
MSRTPSETRLAEASAVFSILLEYDREHLFGDPDWMVNFDERTQGELAGAARKILEPLRISPSDIMASRTPEDEGNTSAERKALSVMRDAGIPGADERNATDPAISGLAARVMMRESAAEPENHSIVAAALYAASKRAPTSLLDLVSDPANRAAAKAKGRTGALADVKTFIALAMEESRDKNEHNVLQGAAAAIESASSGKNAPKASVLARKTEELLEFLSRRRPEFSRKAGSFRKDELNGDAFKFAAKTAALAFSAISSLEAEAKVTEKENKRNSTERN